MRYSVNIQDLQNQVDKLQEENRKLREEVRNLRCVMMEAASSISPTQEPILFGQLSGQPDHFITSERNPYPEHDDFVIEQRLVFLSRAAKNNGG